MLLLLLNSAYANRQVLSLPYRFACIDFGDTGKTICRAQTVVEDQALDAVTLELDSKTKLKRLHHNFHLRTGVTHIQCQVLAPCVSEVFTKLSVAQEARRFCLACVAPFHSRDPRRTYQEVCERRVDAGAGAACVFAARLGLAGRRHRCKTVVPCDAGRATA